MSGLSCCDVWHLSIGTKRAVELDGEFPECQCEPFSLRAEGGDPVANDELLARIITSPEDYDLNEGQILTQKLTVLYSRGLSVIRSGASDEEIEETIEELMGRQGEPQTLVGAVVLKSSDIREMKDESRWFGIYATDAGKKQHHADLLGTFPTLGSNNQIRKTRDKRRYKLVDAMVGKLIRADSPPDLIASLRAVGF